MIFARLSAALVGGVLLIGSAAAQAPSLTLDGKVKQARHWTLGDPRNMPAQHAEVTYQTDRGPVTAGFTGVPLWSLIDAAGGLDDTGKGAAIRITAKDGWVVVTSTGEMARPILAAGTRWSRMSATASRSTISASSCRVTSTARTTPATW